MRRIVILAVGLSLLAGCNAGSSKSGEVEGKVTYKGQPVNNATLNLVHLDPKGVDLNIPVGQDGSFRSSGVAPGGYKVVVIGSVGKGNAFSMRGMTPEQIEQAKQTIAKMPPEPPSTIPFPDKYKDRDATPLSWNITAGKNPPQNLELTD